MPPDFPKVYVLIGCKEVELYYGTNGRAVHRWLRECGEAELVQLRRGYLRKLAASKGLLTSPGNKVDVRGGGYTELHSGNPALDWLPVRRLRRPYHGIVWVSPLGRPKPILDEG